jgi:hypothetical protein
MGIIVDLPKIQANLSIGTLKEIKGLCQARKSIDWGLRILELSADNGDL